MSSSDVIKFVRQTSLETLPESVVESGKLKILDTLGTLLAGLGTPTAQIARQVACEKAGRNEATVFGASMKAPVGEAAFANTVSATDMDFDDGHWWGVHPAAAVVPCLLAVAESNDSSGREYLEAVVAGYEVDLRAADILNPPPKLLLNHASGTCGAIGAAAGAARLLQLEDEAAVHAVRIAGAHAPLSPVWMYEKGAMVKETMAWGAKTGVEAALLAKAGFTGNPTIFDDSSRDLSSLQTLGSRYEILHSYYKPYSSGRMNHTPIDIVLEMLKLHAIKPDDISKINIEARQWAIRLNNTRPNTVEEAVYSMPFAVAAAIIDGDMSPKQLKPERLNAPEILAAIDKIELTYNPALDKNYQERFKAAVTITTKSGTIHRMERAFPRWEPQHPSTGEDIRSKFEHITDELLGHSGAKEIADAVLSISSLQRAGELALLINARIASK